MDTRLLDQDVNIKEEVVLVYASIISWYLNQDQTYVFLEIHQPNKNILMVYQLMILGWVDLIILNNFVFSQHK